MVLNTDELKQEIKITDTEVETMRNTSRYYSILKEKRESMNSQKSIDLKKKAKNSEAIHYITMDYKESLLVGNKTKSLAYLFKFNDVLTSTVNFDHNKNKTHFLNCRLEKYKHIIMEEKIKREGAKRNIIDTSEVEME